MGKYEENSSNVFSMGESECLQEQQDYDWLELYEKENGMKEVHRLIDDGTFSVNDFLDAIKHLKVIPPYRYVIGYCWKLLEKDMCLEVEWNIKKEQMDKFVDYIRQGKMPDDIQAVPYNDLEKLFNSENVKEFKENGCKKIWYAMIAKLDSLFQENGYIGKGSEWKEIFCSYVKEISYEQLRELALGTHMSIEDFQKLLFTVLKRRNTNFFDKEEVLLYLVLKYGDGYGKYGELYRSLEMLYKTSELYEESEVSVEKLQVKVKALKEELSHRKCRNTLKEELKPDMDIVSEDFLNAVGAKIQFVHTEEENMTEKIKDSIQDICVGENLYFAQNMVTAKEIGILEVVCATELEIPKGSIFEFSVNGEKYQYESIEEVQAGKTEIVKMDLDDLVEKKDRIKLFKEYDKELSLFLRQRKYDNKKIIEGIRKRTAEKIFSDIWKVLDTVKRIRQEQEECMFVGIPDEEESFYVNTADTERIQTLQIAYNPDKKITILKGTKYSVKSKLKDKEAILKVLENKILSKKRNEIIEIKVKALMTEKDFTAIKEKSTLLEALSEKTFIKQEFLEENKIVFKVLDEKIKENVFKIQVGKGVRYKESKKSLNQGTLNILCPIGTFIPKGTRFAFEIDGYMFPYESIEEGGRKEKEILEVPVKLRMLENGEKEKKEILETPVKMPMKEKVDRKQEDDTVVKALSKKKLIKQKFLDENHITLKVVEVPTKTNEKTHSTLKDIQERIYEITIGKEGISKVSEKEGKLNIMCKLGTSIPKGTKFAFQLGEHTFTYESTEERMVLEKQVEDSIQVEWVNIDEFEEIKESESRKDIVESDTVICDIAGEYKIYTLKPMVLGKTKKEKSEDSNKLKKREVVRYIYGQETENKRKISEYKGIPKYGSEYFLNSELFKKTYLSERIIYGENFCNEEQLRNMILTMTFFEFAIVDGKVWDEVDMETFVQMVDERMDECGFMPYYRRGFPYDAFIGYLLRCSDPLRVFQGIWNNEYYA